MTECLELVDVSGCGEGECKICRSQRAPNLESEHGHLVYDALFDGQPMQFLEWKLRMSSFL